MGSGLVRGGVRGEEDCCHRRAVSFNIQEARQSQARARAHQAPSPKTLKSLLEHLFVVSLLWTYWQVMQLNGLAQRKEGQYLMATPRSLHHGFSSHFLPSL